ncbi:MAG: efflux RND transporter periplasmic adaptor subunit, partial [Pseudomonadota bacterium]
SLSLVMATALLAACSPEPEAEPSRAIRPVKTFTVVPSTGFQTLRLPAVIGATDSSLLAFQVSGELLELPVQEGDQVVAGDVLASLDPRAFRNAVVSAQATFDNAETEFNRAERLLREDAIARSVYDQRRADLDIAQANLDSAQKDLDDAVLVAPFDGVVAQLYVESFETVSAQQDILTIQGSNSVDAIIQVPASVVINSERIEPIDTFVYLDAAPDLAFAATLAETAAIADTSSQTFEARFRFEPPADLVVLPGMTGVLEGRFRFIEEELNEQLTVPVSAIIAEAGQPYVWVLDPDTSTVTRRDIVVGQGVGEQVEVVTGLEPGDTIVAAGGKYLFEGAEVRRYER